MATEQTEPEKKGYYTTNSRKVADFLIGFGLYLGIFMINFLISYIYSPNPNEIPYFNRRNIIFPILFYSTGPLQSIMNFFLLFGLTMYFFKIKRNYILIGMLYAFLLPLIVVFLLIGACFIRSFSGGYF